MDIARVAELWRRCYPERFWVDEELIAFNTVSATCVFEDDAFLLSKPGAPGVAHVSAIGAKTFVQCERLLGTLSRYDKQVFGCDWRHFFPGVPIECENLAAWLEMLGFSRGTSVFDLERDLQDYVPPVAPSPRVRPCAEDDGARLSQFLTAEFPGRWHDDAMEKLLEDSSRLFVLELDGDIEGFAMTQMDGDLHRRAGAVWSRSLGPNWAALGPIGVSRAVRGQGHGDTLLAAALCSLRDQGARQTIIDWTVLTKFYGKHGFETTREYLTYSRQV